MRGNKNGVNKKEYYSGFSDFETEIQSSENQFA